jgi:hypothetical protein
VLAGDIDDRILQFLMFWPRPHQQHRARPIPRTDEDVLGPGGRVNEVPLLQRPLLTFDQQQAFAVEHQEVLLRVLAVVHAIRLARVEHLDVDPEVGESRIALEDDGGPERVVVPPARVTRVHDEPAVTFRDEPTLRLRKLRFLGHADLPLDLIRAPTA